MPKAFTHTVRFRLAWWFPIVEPPLMWMFEGSYRLLKLAYGNAFKVIK